MNILDFLRLARNLLTSESTEGVIPLGRRESDGRIVAIPFDLFEGSSPTTDNHKGFTKRVNFEDGRAVYLANVVASINTGVGTRSTTLPFTVTSLDTPVAIFIYADDYIYKYLFYGGNGTWGLGGTPITQAMLSLFDVQQLTVDDVTNDPNTQTISLGSLPTGDYVTAANSVSRDLSNEDLVYYFSYTQDGVLYLVQFIGTNGIYGGSGTQLVSGDFAASTNSDVTPLQDLQSATDNGNTTSNDIIHTDESATIHENGLGDKQAVWRYVDNYDLDLSDPTFRVIHDGNIKYSPLTVLGVEADANGNIDPTLALSGQFIPTTGTTEDNPVTADIEFNPDSVIGLYQNNSGGTSKKYEFQDDGTIIEGITNPDFRFTRLIGIDGMLIESTNPDAVGLSSPNDFTAIAKLNPLAYLQTKGVEELIASAGGGGGATNLSYTASPTNGIVNSDTGTGATVTAATTTNAGLLLPADKIKLNNTAGSNNGDNAVNTTSNTYADAKVQNSVAPSPTIAPSATALLAELLKYPKILIEDVTTYTYTGSTTETILHLQTIPANTLSAGVLSIKFTFSNTGIAAAKTVTCYLSNVATAGTADSYGRITPNAAGRFHRVTRDLKISAAGLVTSANQTTSTPTDEVVNGTTKKSSVTLDLTQPIYVFATVTLANVSDDMTQEIVEVIFKKQQ